jgi:cytochrome c oxidase subunit IV
MSGHVVSIKLYVTIFIALLLLTGLTTGVAYIDLGAFNTVAALAIAVLKMLLVILFFMHVKYSPKLTKLVIVAAFFWLGLLLTFTLSDVFSRSWTPVPQSWGPAITAPAPRTK